MAITHKLSVAELKSVVATYVANNKIALDTFSETRNNVVGLLDKIGKILHIETSFDDKLTFFDADSLEYGKTVEEWESDLELPIDYTGDDNGEEALKRYNLTYRKPSYSYTLGRKMIPLSIPNDNVERAVHNQGEYESIINNMTKRMFDSEKSYKYAMKRQMIGNLIKKVNDAQGTTSTYSNTGSYDVGVYLKESSTSDVRGVTVKRKNATSMTWTNAVAQGYIIPLSMQDVIAIPTDEASGEAFIEKVKKDVEIAQDINEGHSLNGNTLGASNNLVLLVKQGVVPSLDVKTMAGAFNQDKLALGVDIVVVKDFGDDTSAFSILMDKRGAFLFNTYRAVRENLNGAGDFLNMFLHFEYTAHISKNTFVKVYKGA